MEVHVDRIRVLERVLRARLRDVQVVRMALHPAQRKLAALLDDVAQAARQLQLPCTGHHDRLHRENATLAHASHDEPVHEPAPLLPLPLVLVPARDPENLL